jgi:hypothetical protein
MKVQLGKVGKVLFKKGDGYKLKAKINSRIGLADEPVVAEETLVS